MKHLLLVCMALMSVMALAQTYVAKVGSTSYTSIESAIDAALTESGKKVSLLSDVTLARDIVVEEGRLVTIDLLCHTIYMGTKSATASYQIKNYGSLRLVDSGNDLPGLIKNGKNENGGAVYNEGTLYLERVEFYGNTAVNGGAIYNTGTITSGSGWLTNNTATGDGGGLYNNGGSVSLKSFLKCCGNTAKNGGLIAGSGGTIVIQRTSVSGNKASNDGGAFYYSGGKITLSSTVKGNEAEGNGGAFYLDQTACSLDGASVEENTCKGSGAGIYAKDLTVSLGGTAIVYNNKVDGNQNNIDLTGTSFLKLLTGNSAPNIKMKVGLFNAPADGKFMTSSITETFSKCLLSDDNKYTIKYANSKVQYVEKPDEAKIGETFYKDLSEAWADALAAADKDGSTIEMLWNVILSSDLVVDEGKSVYLDLGGKTLSMGTKSSSESYMIKNSGSLTILDSSADLTGVITNGKNVNGGAIYNNATLTIEGGSIKQNNASINGGAIYNNGGSVTIAGGQIDHNDATADGGAIYSAGGTVRITGGKVDNNSAKNAGAVKLDNNATMIMTGGIITANISNVSGGAVVASESTVRMTGGSITSNVCYGTKFGGGVDIDNSTFTIGGTAVVSGNMLNSVSNDIDLEGKYTLKIATGDDAPQSGMKVGVCNVKSDKIIVEEGAPAGVSLYFVSNDDDYKVSNDDYKLKLVELPKEAKIGDQLYTLVSAIKAANKVTDPVKVELVTDVTLTENIDIYFSAKITLDLAGYTINMGGEDGTKQLRIINYGELEIRDSSPSQTGTIRGGNVSGVISNTTKGVLSIFGGIFTGNAGDNGCVICNSNITDIMGGVFRGNTAKNNGGAISNDIKGILTISKASFENNSAAKGGAIYNAGGTVTITGGEYTSNTATEGGAVFCDTKGTITIDGGTFKGNKATSGGAVKIAGESKVEMQGGKIVNNQAKIYGGGIMLDNSTFVLTGGEVTDNICLTTETSPTYYGGGIDVRDPVSFTIGGTAVVKNNLRGDVVNNIDFENCYSMTIATGNYAPAEGMCVGVGNAPSNGIFVTDGATADNMVYFFSDNDDKKIVYKEEGMLKLESKISTAVEDVDAQNNQKTIKTIENGQIVIIRNGERYDLAGRKIE